MLNDELLNDLAGIGIPAKRKATINTCNGTFSLDIDIISINLSERKVNSMIHDFNESVRAMEYVGGVTYSFKKTGKRPYKSVFVSSSSLEELWEMFKADRTDQEIPERKCNFMDYMSKKKKK